MSAHPANPEAPASATPCPQQRQRVRGCRRWRPERKPQRSRSPHSQAYPETERRPVCQPAAHAPRQHGAAHDGPTCSGDEPGVAPEPASPTCRTAPPAGTGDPDRFAGAGVSTQPQHRAAGTEPSAPGPSAGRHGPGCGDSHQSVQSPAASPQPAGEPTRPPPSTRATCRPPAPHPTATTHGAAPNPAEERQARPTTASRPHRRRGPAHRRPDLPTEPEATACPRPDTTR